MLLDAFKLCYRLQCFAEVFSMLLKERQCQLAKHLVCNCVYLFYHLYSHIGWVGSSSINVHSTMVPVFVHISTLLGYCPSHL